VQTLCGKEGFGVVGGLELTHEREHIIYHGGDYCVVYAVVGVWRVRSREVRRGVGRDERVGRGRAAQVRREIVRGVGEFGERLAHDGVQAVGGFPHFVREGGVLLLAQKDGHVEEVLDVKAVPFEQLEGKEVEGGATEGKDVEWGRGRSGGGVDAVEEVEEWRGRGEDRKGGVPKSYILQGTVVG
jgi:hypothetical protein